MGLQVEELVDVQSLVLVDNLRGVCKKNVETEKPQGQHKQHSEIFMKSLGEVDRWATLKDREQR